MWNTEPKKGVPCWQKLLVAAEEESRFITICPLTIISIIFIIVLLTKAIGVTKSKECVNTLEITQIDFQPVFSKTDQSEQKKAVLPKNMCACFIHRSVWETLLDFGVIFSTIEASTQTRSGAETWTLTRVDDRMCCELLHLFSFGKVSRLNQISELFILLTCNLQRITGRLPPFLFPGHTRLQCVNVTRKSQDSLPHLTERLLKQLTAYGFYWLFNSQCFIKNLQLNVPAKKVVKMCN